VVHSSDIGFTYTLPADWEVGDTKPTLPVVQQQVANEATGEDVKKGIGCVQVVLAARHGVPPTVVTVAALPFACFGQPLEGKDLPGFASGSLEGLKGSLNFTDPEYKSYSLGSHSMWIERDLGTVRDHPEVKYTVEAVCSLLQKGAACWMAMAADRADLQTFEHGTVTLDGESPAMLVPAGTFAKAPTH